MSTKTKIIVIAVSIIALLISYICVYVYVNKLSSTIIELKSTISKQEDEISNLKHNIDSLNKEIESFDKTSSITDEYISDINKINNEDATVKQMIYEQVISNDEVKSWFNETLPDNVVAILNSDANDGVCENSN